MKIWKNELGFLRAELTVESTLQEIFDAVTTRLRDGTGRCLSGGFCTYREEHTNNLNACAIGIFIPDDEFRSWVIDSAADALIKYGFEDLGSQGLMLANALQRAHDADAYWNDNDFNSKGEIELARTAQQFCVEYKPPV